jgi:hypothetical protein
MELTGSQRSFVAGAALRLRTLGSAIVRSAHHLLPYRSCDTLTHLGLPGIIPTLLPRGQWRLEDRHRLC